MELSEESPRLSTAELSADVSTTAAFASIQQLVGGGQVAVHEGCVLEAGFRALHTAARAARRAEAFQLAQCRALQDQIKEYGGVEERGVQAFLEDSSEGGQLARTLVKAANAHYILAQQHTDNEALIATLQEEKGMMIEELTRRQRSTLPGVDAQLFDLRKTLADLTQELPKRQVEIEQLRMMQEDSRKKAAMTQLRQEECLKESEKIKAQIAAEAGEPGRVAKQAEVFGMAAKGCSGKLAEVSASLAKLTDELTALNSRKAALQSALLEIGLGDEQLSGDVEFLRKKEMLLKNQLERVADDNSDALAAKAALEIERGRLNVCMKGEGETNTRLAKQKERHLRALHHVESQLDGARFQVGEEERKKHRICMELEAKKKEAADFDALIPKAQADLEAAQHALAAKANLSQDQKSKITAAAAKNQELQKTIAALELQRRDLETQGKSAQEELNQGAAEYMRAEAQFARANDDTKRCQFLIDAHAKQYQSALQSITSIEQVYQLMKNEKNKATMQIYSASLKRGELRSAVDVLLNETEILRGTVLEKNAKLVRAHATTSMAVNEKVALRKLHADLKVKDEALKDQKTTWNGANRTLLDTIEQQENSMIQIREKYDSTVRERNELGLRLVDRQDELCAFYEKVNIQESILRNATLELQQREEEIKFMHLEKQDLLREIELLRRQQPVKRQLESELIDLQIELLATKEEQAKLDAAASSAETTSRYRLLQGKDPTLPELQKQLKALENRLAIKEQKFLELELINDETTKLIERSRKQVLANKDSTFTLATQIADYQSKIKDLTKKTKAVVAELCMYQAQAMELEQDLDSKRSQLDEANGKLERGEPPSEEAQREWTRMKLQQQQLEASATMPPVSVETQFFELADGTRTLAQPRPTAYMPTNEAELQIAQPYGALAPFKPTQPGTNMRHIRKPNPKPIVI
eukprot:m.581202 g.581202  ORF g.581202 m.581202 type:complete len:935 (+) comp57935_c0_seq2:19-2823(+)